MGTGTGERKRYKGFKPEWEQVPPPEKSFRSILKWGNPLVFKEPNERLYSLLKQVLNLSDKDFSGKMKEGHEQIVDSVPCLLHQHIIDKLTAIVGVGEKGFSTHTYDRLSASYGKTMFDLFRLREKIIENIPDIVLFPGSKKEIEDITAVCAEYSVPLYVYGGGSSVTRGTEAVKGGVTLDLRKNFNKVVEFNETNQTITVEAGISGPKLEEVLNNAEKLFNAKRSYTCGHFPQSFEYSSVGGWVVTRGAGQNSTYYGNIKDIVFRQWYSTPVGPISTYGLPAHAVGPDLDEIMMGSEGAYGVLTHVTLRFFRYQPENRKRFSYIFRTWEDTIGAAREIVQHEAGFPSVFRLSDPEETDVMLKMYKVEGTIIESAMNLFGYKPMERCLFLGWTEGEKGFSKNLNQTIGKICRKFGGFYLTGYPVSSWEHGRFTDPYLRESLQDYGIIIDTMECGVTWDSMKDVHAYVRAFAKSRPDTVCMTHISHAYPQGANLYFIFIGKFNDKEEYLEYQSGIFDNILSSGASMSHHHGVGKMTAQWVEQSVGSERMNVFRALKNHFDPDNIMNPGGTLGLDMTEKERRKPRFSGKKWG